jgi:hypothetical protein
VKQLAVDACTPSSAMVDSISAKIHDVLDGASLPEHHLERIINEPALLVSSRLPVSGWINCFRKGPSSSRFAAAHFPRLLTEIVKSAELTLSISREGDGREWPAKFMNFSMP